MAIINQTVERRKHFSTVPSILLMETLGERLRHFAKVKYKTLTAFGEAIGMSPASLTHYVQDKRAPGTDILRKFRQAGINVEWLLFGEGPMEATEERPSVTFFDERIMIIDIDNNRILSEDEARERLTRKEQERKEKK